jgi:hypothetical protein
MMPATATTTTDPPIHQDRLMFVAEREAGAATGSDIREFDVGSIGVAASAGDEATSLSTRVVIGADESTCREGAGAIAIGGEASAAPTASDGGFARSWRANAAISRSGGRPSS